MSLSSKGVVLVIEEEPLKCATLRIELSEAGYTVVAACSPSEGIKHLTVQHIDVVVTDLSMPDMDGLQLLERVKAVSPATQVILMTAFGSVDSAVEAMK